MITVIVKMGVMSPALLPVRMAISIVPILASVLPRFHPVALMMQYAIVVMALMNGTVEWSVLICALLLGRSQGQRKHRFALSRLLDMSSDKNWPRKGPRCW